jgi:hypothetical protein
MNQSNNTTGSNNNIDVVAIHFTFSYQANPQALSRVWTSARTVSAKLLLALLVDSVEGGAELRVRPGPFDELGKLARVHRSLHPAQRHRGT